MVRLEARCKGIGRGENTFLEECRDIGRAKEGGGGRPIPIKAGD